MVFLLSGPPSVSAEGKSFSLSAAAHGKPARAPAKSFFFPLFSVTDGLKAKTSLCSVNSRAAAYWNQRDKEAVTGRTRPGPHPPAAWSCDQARWAWFCDQARWAWFVFLLILSI